MDWEDVRIFATVAQCRTVRAAAKELNIHHSTVSRRIEHLENALSTRLFDRQPEGYVLTEAGENLAVAADATAKILDSAERQLFGHDNELTGRIAITMAEPLAVYGFAPRMQDFAERFPGLDLEIIATADMLDMARREADVAIRMDNNPPQSLIGKRLFAYHTTIYASPDYLENLDAANNPEHGRWLGYDIEDGRFPGWTQDTEFARVPVWGAFPNLELQVAAAAAGMGLAMLPCYVADRHSGLVRATQKAPQAARDIWILTHPDLRQTQRIRAVMNFAESVLRSQRSALLGDLDAE